MIQIDNRRIAVTGAAGGLGSVLVSTLVECGARVAGVVKTQADADELTRRIACDKLSTVVLDLQESDQIAAVIADDIAAHGPFYGLVNNAAIYPKTAIADLPMEELRSVLTVNAIAAAAMVRACLPGMKTLGAGRIIGIASNTFDMGMAELSAYVGSKGALIGMARVWARELGPPRDYGEHRFPRRLPDGRRDHPSRSRGIQPFRHIAAGDQAPRRPGGVYQARGFSAERRGRLHHRPEHPHRWRLGDPMRPYI